MTSEICGTTPEAWTFRQKISAYPASETTPSWMRAPPESLIPITGQPYVTARSMTLHLLGEDLRERAAEDREVLGEDEHLPAEDRPVAGDDGVPHGRLSRIPNSTSR